MDLGNYFRRPGPDAAEINTLMMESLRGFPLQVLNLAPEDLHLWPELSKSDSIPTQVISTNLSPRQGTAPARFAVVEIEGSRVGLHKPLRIGFLGLSEPRQVKPNSGFTGQDPLEAVAAVKAEVLRRSDFLIVLADLPRDLARQIAAANPEIYAVLVTERMFVLPPPEQVNNAVILSSVERGRYLGRLTFQLDAAGDVISYEPEFTDLDRKVPENPEWLRRQQQLSTTFRAR